MVRLNELTSSPANVAGTDLVALYDNSSGYLTQLGIEQLLKPVCGSLTGTGVSVGLGAVGATWTKATAFDAIGTVSNGTTVSSDNDQITVDKPYLCAITYSITLYNDTGTRQLGARLAVDGTAVAGSYGHEVTTAATAVCNISGTVLRQMSATEVVTVEVAHTASPTTGNMYVTECSLVITPIAPA